MKEPKFKEKDKVIYQKFNSNVGGMYSCFGSEAELTVVSSKKSNKDDSFDYILKDKNEKIFEINEELLKPKVGKK